MSVIISRFNIFDRDRHCDHRVKDCSLLPKSSDHTWMVLRLRHIWWCLISSSLSLTKCSATLVHNKPLSASLNHMNEES